MNNEELKATIQRYLDLVERSSASATENERALAVLLDQLALATHTVERTEPDTVELAPSRDYYAMRAEVGARFPNYGFYHCADTNPLAEAMTGDAIDDIADIALELSSVLWLWENFSAEEALWHFHDSFGNHWGCHLRELQWYVHKMEQEGRLGYLGPGPPADRCGTKDA